MWQCAGLLPAAFPSLTCSAESGMSQRNLKGSESPWESAERGLVWSSRRGKPHVAKRRTAFHTHCLRHEKITWAQQTQYLPSFSSACCFPCRPISPLSWTLVRENTSASYFWTPLGERQRKHFRFQLEALKHISALLIRVFRFTSVWAAAVLQQTQTAWFILMKLTGSIFYERRENRRRLTKHGHFRVFSHAAQRRKGIEPDHWGMHEKLSHRNLCDLREDTREQAI